jgi:hypothetical protein
MACEVTAQASGAFVRDMAATILRIIGTARSCFARALCRPSMRTPAGRASRAVGVRHCQIAQDIPFGRLHPPRLRIVHVIIAKKMQKAVHHEMAEMMVERLAVATRFAVDGFVSEHDVAQVVHVIVDLMN